MRRTTIAIGLAALVLALLGAPNVAYTQDYVAYAETKDGEFPVPADVDDIEDKHLIEMRWGDYNGPTRRVAVMPVDNTSSANSFRASFGDYGGYEWGGNEVPVNGIEAMITDSMQRSGRFRLVERTEVGNVLGEQDLASAGRTTQQSGAATGQILGAEYLVQAVVTSYEPDIKGKKGGLGGITGGVLGGVGAKKEESLVGMNFRLVNAETSEIVFTKQVDVTVSDSGFAFGGIGWGSAGALGGFLSSYSKTPVGQAVMAAVNQGVLELVKQIGSEPMEGSVVQVKDGDIYVNLGEDVVEQGEILEAHRLGEQLIDPDTGLSLGGETEVLGQIQLASVKDRFSIGRALDFDASSLSRGDLVVSTKPPPPLKFASQWDGPLSKEQKKKRKGKG